MTHSHSLTHISTLWITQTARTKHTFVYVMSPLLIVPLSSIVEEEKEEDEEQDGNPGSFPRGCQLSKFVFTHNRWPEGLGNNVAGRGSNPMEFGGRPRIFGPSSRRSRDLVKVEWWPSLRRTEVG